MKKRVSVVLSAARRGVTALGFDRTDARTFVGLSVRAAIVVGYAATAGAAVRVFFWASGIGRVFGWEF